MSWLDNKIHNVLNRDPEDIDVALAAMMTEVLAEYQERSAQNALRVNDADGEGILYGLRDNTVRNPETNIFELTCNSLTVERGREEAFSRAVFNQRQMQLGDSVVNFISYEAPLLRKHEGHGGDICKLDLVGLGQGALWAIEYKQRHAPATSARYGVLEALAYGVLLARHIHDNPAAINQQVNHCITERGPYPGPAIVFNAATTQVKFAVAAPMEFFREDTRTARRRDKTRQFTAAACRYATQAAHIMGVNLVFGGFLIIGDDNMGFASRDVGGGMVVRSLQPPIHQAPQFNTIGEVYAFLAQ